MLELLGGLGVIGVILVLLVAVSPLLCYFQLRKLNNQIENLRRELHDGVTRNLNDILYEDYEYEENSEV